MSPRRYIFVILVAFLVVSLILKEDQDHPGNGLSLTDTRILMSLSCAGLLMLASNAIDFGRWWVILVMLGPAFSLLWVRVMVTAVFGPWVRQVCSVFTVVSCWMALATFSENVVKPFMKSSKGMTWFGGPLRPGAVAGMNLDRAAKELEVRPHREKLEYYQAKRRGVRRALEEFRKQSEELQPIISMRKKAAEDMGNEPGVSPPHPDDLRLLNALETIQRQNETSLRALEDLYNRYVDEVASQINEMLNTDRWNTKWH